jgi:ferredoxin hydrogenase large subunit
MANSFDQLNFFKKRALEEVAKRTYEGTLRKEDVNDIALSFHPYGKSQYRCCIYKEREITRERLYLAMGYTPEGKEQIPGQFIYVLEAACDDCSIHRVRITDNCRKCLFKACVNACKFGAIREGNSKMHIEYDKCKACTMCAKACPYGSILLSDRPCHKSCPTGALKYIEGQIAQIKDEECVNCGQCAANCPFGGISEISFVRPVIEEMKKGKKVIAMVAPAIVGQWENSSLQQVYQALNEIGFTDIMEVAVGADLTTKNEAEEALEAKKKGLKITTSCCPAFVSFLQLKFPKVYENHTSNVLSPMAITARLAREKYGEDAVTVFIGPCVAKKAERLLPKNLKNIDYVLTFEEVHAMMAAKGVVPKDLEGNSAIEAGSYSGRNFCNTGGVAKSLNDYLAEVGEEERLTLKAASGPKLVVQYVKELSQGKQTEDVLEGMMCEGGCMGGVDSRASNLILAKSHAEKQNISVKSIKIGAAAEKYTNVNCHFNKATNE